MLRPRTRIGELRPTLIVVTVSSVVPPLALALSLYACQLAVWEIAEPHVRKNTNKQLQVFIVFFIMFGFKLTHGIYIFYVRIGPKQEVFL